MQVVFGQVLLAEFHLEMAPTPVVSPAPTTTTPMLVMRMPTLFWGMPVDSTRVGSAVALSGSSGGTSMVRSSASPTFTRTMYVRRPGARAATTTSPGSTGMAMPQVLSARSRSFTVTARPVVRAPSGTRMMRRGMRPSTWPRCSCARRIRSASFAASPCASLLSRTTSRNSKAAVASFPSFSWQSASRSSVPPAGSSRWLSANA